MARLIALFASSKFFMLFTALIQVPRLGMSTPFRGRTIQDVTKQVVSIAKGGLERRGLDEVIFWILHCLTHGKSKKLHGKKYNIAIIITLT